MTKTKQLLLTLFLALSIVAFGQKPEIKSLSTLSEPTGDLVTINGDNFGTDATRMVVFFGATKGTIENVTNQVIEARVPAGTTYDHVSVTNLLTGLTGYSRNQFLLSFGGTHPFDLSNLQGQFDFNADKGLYDLCMCDFDGDNRTDIATASDNSTAIKFLANTSTGPGNINFNTAAPSIPLGTRSIHVKCGDLNGDGKPDMVITEGGDGNRIFIFKNNSTGAGNFAFGTQALTLTGRKTKRIEIADLDGDGKPEVIVTDQGSNVLSVLPNTSTLASITFGATVNYTVTGAGTTDGITVDDFNGDGKIDVAVSQFLTSASNVYVIANSSTSGNISFGPQTTLNLGGTVVNLRAGDLDGDSKPDIAASQLLNSAISIYRNTSTGSISFAAPQSVTTDIRPWGIDFGDLDGDGKADIVVPSLTKNVLTILNNTSSPGSLSFVRQIISTTYINRHTAIGDLDTDGKPDIAFTSIDDNTNSIEASKVSVFRNRNCMIPVVTPAGPLSVCSGFPLRLFATVSRGVTYEWRDLSSNTVVATGANPYFDVTVSGKYEVTAIAEGGACSEKSNVVEVTVGVGTVAGTAVATNNGPLCVGNTLQLQVNNVGATEYRWTGPNGYTGTGLTPASIPNFQAVNVGRYSVDVIAGTCVAQRTSTVVEAIDIGNFTVTYPGSNVVCSGNTKTLTVSPILGGATYQWFEQTGGVISGQTSSSYTASTTGNYYCRISYPGCGSSDTAPVRIVVAVPPVAAFTANASACTGQLITFTNQSTSDANATANYLWTFGDGNTSTDMNPQHSYSTASTFNVTLQVSYEGGVCPNTTAPFPITVQSATIPTITNPQNTYVFCPGDSLRLEVLGNYNSYAWSTGATTSFIFAKTGGTYSVEVTTASCTLNASRDVQTYSAPMVIAAASPELIMEGQTSQLNADGLTSYEWTPEESLSSSTIADPVAQPLVTTEYTVTGLDNNGCRGTATVTVQVKGESIVSKVTPGKFFSPNGDGTNNTWVIEDITDYPQCTVTIYDEKGVKVFESKPYNNDWDGRNLNGKSVPDGVYYYIIRCDGEESNPRKGTVTLLR
jgi:gliding motility-associated-like protein